MAFVCDICEKQFSQKTNLARHKKAVHGVRSFNCERCGVAFNRNDALKRHMKKHSQDKTHQCQHCSRQFYRQDVCLEHQKLCEFEKRSASDNGMKRKHSAVEADSDAPARKEIKLDDKVDHSVPSQAANEAVHDDNTEDPCGFTSAFKDTLKTFKLNPVFKRKTI